jgi:osmotically-inducible protein OsmY
MKFPTQKLLTLLALTACIGAGLSACAPIIVGGAVMGSLMATDRRTTGTQVEDEGIELRSGSRLRDNPGERVHVNVTSYNRQVLLTGEAPTAQDRQLVEQVVSKVGNVRAIVNEIGILGITTLSQRANDAYITGKVKAGMVDTRDLFANAFKVVTERSTVYLMGRVTQREANRATDIARSTDGVQKVVRMLEIISEDELHQLLPKPAPVEGKK